MWAEKLSILSGKEMVSVREGKKDIMKGHLKELLKSHYCYILKQQYLNCLTEKQNYFLYTVNKKKIKPADDWLFKLFALCPVTNILLPSAVEETP